MKTMIGITVLFFFAINDAHAVFCDPSGANSGNTGTMSKYKGSDKGDSPDEFGENRCVDLPPITVTGYYVSYSANYFDSVIYALGGLGIPAGAIVISDGVAAQPEGNKFGCGNSSLSDRQRIAARGFLRAYQYHLGIVEIGFVEGNLQAFVESSAWLGLHDSEGTRWERSWPDGSTSTMRIYGHVDSNGQTANAAELRCNE